MNKSKLKNLAGFFLAGIVMVLFCVEITGQDQERIERPALPERSDQAEMFLDINDNGFVFPQSSTDKNLSMGSKASATGTYTIGSADHYDIPDDGYRTLYYHTTESLPEDAVITNVAYQIIVDDRGDPDNFWCSDYEIWLSSASHSSLNVSCFWNNLGSKTDNDDDDDAADDSDIYLFNNTHDFDGEPADQVFRMTFYDNVSVVGAEGLGLKDRVYLIINWEVPDYNLDATVTPSGWNGPILVQQSGGYSELYTELWTSVNFSYYSDINIPSSEHYSITLSDNGSEVGTWDAYGASAGGPHMLPDNLQLKFSAGEHIICQRVDWLMEIDESNEDDNVHCETFTFYGPPSAPSLTSPGHQASCQPTNAWLDWSTVSHTHRYQLQVDNNSDLSSPFYSNDEIISSEMTVTGLSAGTQYYWRVRAINPAGSGTWSAIRAFQTVPASGPVPPGLNSPADGAGCQSTSLTLDWNSVSEAESYNLQVDDNDDFSSTLVNQTGLTGTNYDLTGLSAGTSYYWRVAAVNSCGMSSSWSGVYDFTISASPSTPGLSSPDNNATCQTTSPNLSWSSVSGAVGYQLNIDNNDDFSSPEVEETDIGGTSISVSGLSTGTKYYWIVRAQNGCGIYSGWSSARSFTTSPSSPDVPTLNTPADDAGCQAVSLSLEWSAGNGASSYVVQLDDNDDFSSPVVNETVAATNNAVSGLAEGTRYYWRIRSENSCGEQSVWSSSRSFTTIVSSIDPPTLSGPADVSTCQPTSPTLTWGEVTGATAYNVEVDNNADFSSPEVSATSNGTTYNCTGLSENTSYNWRIAATSACSVTGSWSDSWSFQTGSNGMAPPTLSDPADQSTNQALNLSLSWEAVTDAVSYQFQLDDNDDFSSPLYDDEESSTTKSVSGLSEGTTYYWQVRANGSCSTGDWSETREFETEGNTPDALSYSAEEDYYLGQNYPNPFMETTTIEFRLPVDDHVSIDFMDLQGKVIETLSGYYTAGAHTVEINLQGKYLSGVYLYRMRTTGFVETRMGIVR